MDTAAALEPSEPIIIYRTLNRDGQTFAIEPLSLKRLRQAFGNEVRVHPVVFVAHETAADYGQLHGDVVAQVIQLLTGVSEARLDSFGGVSLRDPVTDDELARP
ncbi:MAG TPA: hypothetical protein VM869_20945 [Enhygromyxa sp.]|nr:hypothetical protein [Enhygromyxa sp.]